MALLPCNLFIHARSFCGTRWVIVDGRRGRKCAGWVWNLDNCGSRELWTACCAAYPTDFARGYRLCSSLPTVANIYFSSLFAVSIIAEGRFEFIQRSSLQSRRQLGRVGYCKYGCMLLVSTQLPNIQSIRSCISCHCIVRLRLVFVYQWPLRVHLLELPSTASTVLKRVCSILHDNDDAVLLIFLLFATHTLNAEPQNDRRSIFDDVYCRRHYRPNCDSVCSSYIHNHRCLRCSLLALAGTVGSNTNCCSAWPPLRFCSFAPLYKLFTTTPVGHSCEYSTKSAPETVSFNLKITGIQSSLLDSIPARRYIVFGGV